MLWRAAFVQEMLAAVGLDAPALYRGVHAEEALRAPEPSAFVSATFSLEVAADFLGTPGDGFDSVLVRQRVPRERVFMTYLETAAMNRQFLEGEAVLFGDPSNPLF